VNLIKGLHVALVGPLPPPSGGMANQTRQLVRFLSESEVNVDLIQVNPPYRPAWIGKIWGIRALCRLLPYVFKLWRVVGSVQLMHIMANSGWSWHLFVAPAVWIAYLRGVPVIINYHGGQAETFLARSFFLINPTLKLADLVIVPSGFLEKIFSKYGVTTCIVANVIDLSHFQKTARKRNHIAPILLITRNLEPIYGIPTALKAFAILHKSLPNAQLVIAGSGPQLKELKQLAEMLDISNSVTFTGRVDNDRISELYHNADLMINPSMADNMPISVLESMCCGVPVVSSNVGGIPYLLKHKDTALLVPPGDEDALATAILTVFENPKLANKLSEAGLEVIQQFTWPQVKGKLFAAYCHVLSVHKTNHCDNGLIK
jgi:glycosyltransferase involved in cell wall biosynthesis